MKPTRTCADCPAPITLRYARYCPDCRWKHRLKHKKYELTPEREAILRERYDPRVKGRAKELAALMRVPPWRLKHWAVALGLSYRRADVQQMWTAEEEAFLWAHCGRRTLDWMARTLKRTEASVALKIKRMRLRRRWAEGYTLRELCLCFGVDHKVIRKWIADGMLAARRRGVSSDCRDGWYVTDADLLRFIQARPMTFELRRVDQHWFMDLILDGALVRKALASETALEREVNAA